MATSLFRICYEIRSYHAISIFKPIVKEIFHRIENKNLYKNTLLIKCSQYRSYYITSTVFKKRSKFKEKEEKYSVAEISKKDLPSVRIWKNMTVAELAQAANRSVADILESISYIDKNGTYKSYTVLEDISLILKTVRILGAKAITTSEPNKLKIKSEETIDVFKRPTPDESVLVKRHPVVTIMGHVDHGKTTLLDALRKSSVVDSEFGGITQHIGAFNVILDTSDKVTFLDTPGHAAFSTMRARGAKVTDIVVLVVAADDGVMDQTVQSIEMANEANVPIVVAINKIDKPEADIERTWKMLAQRGIIVEQLGGDVQCVSISALKGTNLKGLIEVIVMQAELMELKGDPTGPVEAVVIESSNHIGRGKLATILIQRGTLKKGAVLVCGLAWAKVRAMFDHAGNVVAQATLSEAVQIIGWRNLPVAGTEILEVPSERIANMVIKHRETQENVALAQEHKIAADKKHEEHLLKYKEEMKLRKSKGRFYKIRSLPKKLYTEDNHPHVNIIIKGDVLGSVEAILDVLDTYNIHDKCSLNVVHYGVGQLTETDLELADAFDAIIYNFNVLLPSKLKDLAKEKDIKIRSFNVIYKLIDDLKIQISSQLPSLRVEEFIGEASVLQEFDVTVGKKKMKVAGCRCTKGILKKSANFHVKRNDEIIFTGKLASMRHLKNEVDSIKVDVECGLRLENFTQSFQPGDIVVCFEYKIEEQVTEWDPGF